MASRISSYEDFQNYLRCEFMDRTQDLRIYLSLTGSFVWVHDTHNDGNHDDRLGEPVAFETTRASNASDLVEWAYHEISWDYGVIRKNPTLRRVVRLNKRTSEKQLLKLNVLEGALDELHRAESAPKDAKDYALALMILVSDVPTEFRDARDPWPFLEELGRRHEDEEVKGPNLFSVKNLSPLEIFARRQRALSNFDRGLEHMKTRRGDELFELLTLTYFMAPEICKMLTVEALEQFQSERPIF